MHIGTQSLFRGAATIRGFISMLCMLGILVASGCVRVDSASQRLMAVQGSEAILVRGLAAHVKSLHTDTAGDREKGRAQELYFVAARDNNAVIEHLLGQLATPQVSKLSVDKELSQTASSSLYNFREYAQNISSTGDLAPLHPILASKGDVLLLAALTDRAMDAIRFWLEENERARDVLRTHLERYILPGWEAIQ